MIFATFYILGFGGCFCVFFFKSYKCPLKLITLQKSWPNMMLGEGQESGRRVVEEPGYIAGYREGEEPGQREGEEPGQMCLSSPQDHRSISRAWQKLQSGEGFEAYPIEARQSPGLHRFISVYILAHTDWKESASCPTRTTRVHQWKGQDLSHSLTPVSLSL